MSIRVILSDDATAEGRSVCARARCGSPHDDVWSITGVGAAKEAAKEAERQREGKRRMKRRGQESKVKSRLFKD